ncbi:hypothetical protein [Allomesorhizobium camelthorni]|uniref:Uncharacterized protein n=1 Tax=Allomesorhizobium camelthorni TaxID=475069 RepID=A0A6G4WP10_9HYPH|nr:hypothetical protein [Mesorhizobium camelthorni]NGO56118.1 hypothetical protein [Mesorhizobium camelthorni]
MTAAIAARYGAVEAALPSGFVTAELHLMGRDRSANENSYLFAGHRG